KPGCTTGEGRGGLEKCPERPTSVPCRCFEAQRPGRGADPRYPLGPPLMLSPVALPGTGALDGISDPFPLADPSGQRRIYEASAVAATELSTNSRPLACFFSTSSNASPRLCPHVPRAPTRAARAGPEASHPLRTLPSGAGEPGGSLLPVVGKSPLADPP